MGLFERMKICEARFGYTTSWAEDDSLLNKMRGFELADEDGQDQ